MVGDARHRHPPDRLAGLLAGEGELQQAREQQGVFKEELVEVAEAVEQHPLGMSRLELHVVAQHRRQGSGVHQAVVVPAGQVGVGLGVEFVGGVLAFTGAGGRGGASLGLGFGNRCPDRWLARCGGESCSLGRCLCCCCGRRSTAPCLSLQAPRPGGRVPPLPGPGCRIGLQEVVGVEGFGRVTTGFGRLQGTGRRKVGSTPRDPRSGFPRRGRRFGKQTPLQPRPHQLGN